MLLSHEVFGAHQFDLRLANVWMFHSASKLKSRRKRSFNGPSHRNAVLGQDLT